MRSGAHEPAGRIARRATGPGFHARVRIAVQQIPRGAVATYGDVAAALGSSRVARHVGWALAAMSAGDSMPWWRVVAAGGRITHGNAREQQRLLARDGVPVRAGRVLDFARRRYVPQQ